MLAWLSREHRGQLVADFRRFYHLSWASLPDSGIPLSEIADYAANLPVESATHRAINPGWQHTLQVQLLREVEYLQRVTLWANADPRKRGREPERIRFPWEEDSAERLPGDVMTLDDMADFLDDDRFRKAVGLA